MINSIRSYIREVKKSWGRPPTVDQIIEFFGITEDVNFITRDEIQALIDEVDDDTKPDIGTWKMD